MCSARFKARTKLEFRAGYFVLRRRVQVSRLSTRRRGQEHANVNDETANPKVAAKQYVRTAAIREATAGHELTVLNRLGIQPPTSGHIRCPYPDHGGANDWRWDTQKGRAFCTCTKADSIFDVIMKVDGVNFEEAKIFAANALGRTDLIERRFDAHADALLCPPSSQRDVELPRLYLASRLGVDPTLVLMPNTRAVGWKSLAYHDGRSVVAAPPCTVWETVDRDGRRHAMRIWVNEGGNGKADLGTKDGQKRDVKQSAHKLKGDNTSGRSVIWGNTEASKMILCEGIETASAVAAAFRPEVTSGELFVGAATTATSLEAFRPWLTTKEVVVGADRDELSDGKRPPSFRGEIAARTFCARNDRIETRIALPGPPGAKCDWLDVFAREGPDAVRTGILAAATLAEMPRPEFADRQTHGDAKLSSGDCTSDCRDLYPLPTRSSLILKYQRDRDGRLTLIREITTASGDVHTVAVGSPVGVPARLRYADAADTFGIRVAVEGMDGKLHEVDLRREALASPAGRDVLAAMYGAGLRVEPDGEKTVLSLLKSADPPAEIVVVRRAGWHDLDGVGRIFVCPGGDVVGATADARIELDAASRLAPGVARKGSYDDWKAAVAIACSVPSCGHWAVGVVAGFAGVVLSLAGLDTCGILFSGMTSTGKTLAQRLAASAFSVPSEGGAGLFQSARTTANAIEYVAARASGTVLVLDELAHVPGRELAKLVYSLAGNIGKARMTSDSRPRQQHEWRTFVMMSAERGLAEMIASDGAQMPPGVALRVLDVDVSEVNRSVPESTLEAIAQIYHSYGHAGPAFVNALYAAGLFGEGVSIREQIHRRAQAFAEGSTGGATRRSALVFGLLAETADLMKQFEIQPMSVDVQGAISWAWNAFRSSPESRLLDDVNSVVLDRLTDWIATHWGSKITHVGDDRLHPEAFGWYDDECVYVRSTKLVEATGNVLKEREVARILSRQGKILKRKAADCTFVNHVPKHGPVKAYALSREHFGRPPD
jgi:hypothetical protein